MLCLVYTLSLQLRIKLNNHLAKWWRDEFTDALVADLFEKTQGVVGWIEEAFCVMISLDE